MNEMKEKAMGAVKTFLGHKGYEVVDTVRIGTDGFPEVHRLREALAAK